MIRRDFLQGVGAASAGILLGPRMAGAAPVVKPSVYEIFHKDMLPGTSPVQKKVNASEVKKAMDALVKKAGNKTDLGLAWEALFPGIKTTSKIAIKVNALRQFNSPQLASLQAMVGGMKKMCGGRFPAANIFLFDNDLWYSGKANRVFGKPNLDGLGIWHGEDRYSHSVKCGGASCFASVRWHQADYGVNYLVPRAHSAMGGWLSGFIKNMMGIVSIEKTFYSAAFGNGREYFHEKKNLDYPAYVDLFKYINAKSKCIYIGDMIMMPPSEKENYMEKVVNKLILGKDPCAMDARVVEIIKEEFPKVRTTSQVPAALEKAKLGSMEHTLVKVDPGDPPDEPSVLARGTARGGLEIRTRSDAHRGTVTFFVDGHRDGLLHASIYDPKGRSVRLISIPRNVTSFIWNGRNRKGALVPRGSYLARITAPGQTITKRVQVIR